MECLTIRPRNPRTSAPLDLHVWTVLILMALGTTTMTTISTKRARQRAKIAAADGGSHQSALDGIARSEGHAHWGAKLRSQKTDAVVAGRQPVDFLSRSWVAGRPDVADGLVAFAASALSGLSRGSNEVRPVLATFLTSAWFSERPDGGAAADFPTFVMDMMDAAADEHRRRCREADQVGVYCRDTFNDVLAGMLLQHGERMASRSLHLSVIQHAPRSKIPDVLREIVETARAIADNPLIALRSTSMAMLDDRTIASIVLSCWGDQVPHPAAISVVSRMIADPKFTTFDDATLALGDDVGVAVLLAHLPGLSQERRCTVARLVLEDVPDTTPWPTMVHDGVLDRIASNRPGSLMVRWLQHAYAALSLGRIPYSFNLLADGDPEALRDGVAVLLEIVAINGASFLQEPDKVDAVVRIVSDVLTVIRGVPRIDEFQDGLTPSFPSVRSVLMQARMQPGQLQLFATLNRIDLTLVDRLSASMEDGVADLALIALHPFGNPAMARAAS